MKNLLWYIKSDIELKLETCWYDGVEKIDGFYFYSKKPLSKSYQFHSTIGLENTYKILSLIQKAIKNKKRAIHLQVACGLGTENIYIWKGSLMKAEELMQTMIKQIQKQH